MTAAASNSIGKPGNDDGASQRMEHADIEERLFGYEQENK
jgi:hypothetical protein